MNIALSRDIYLNACVMIEFAQVSLRKVITHCGVFGLYTASARRVLRGLWLQDGCGAMHTLPVHFFKVS